MNYRLKGLALAIVLMLGCASSPTSDEPAGLSVQLEGFNLTMFNFKYYLLDPFVLRTVA
ncbi:phospholipid-binding lipoprotein MlaA, partial [Erwinia amylovora]|nr:phospholipid-binding lipoprotein MlaA [Erwinia amylovora]